MRKILILYILIFSIAAIGKAQRPTGAIVPQALLKRGVSITCMGSTQDAGTFHLGTYQNTSQSNDISIKRIFLCARDRVPLIHDGNEVLNGDPDSATEPGVGYGIYICPPTIDGNTLTAIASDPCLEVNPTPPPPSPFYVIVDGNTSGDMLLNNDGYLNQNFNGGAPGTWWFAPITFDSVADINGTLKAVYEYAGGNKGPCVNVRTDVAIQVTYLNRFEITGVTSSSLNDSTCKGSFTITGGLPEYDTSATYEISIVSSSNFNDVGTLLGSDYHHGDAVEFTVPIGGEYLVTIKDGKSCSQTIPIAIECNTTLQLILPMMTAEPGDTICVPITVNNFDSLSTLSFTFLFNPNILHYIGHENFNIPVNSSWLVVDNHADEGRVTFAWLTKFFPETQLITLPDGTVIIELCFVVDMDAQIGDMSILDFVNQPTPIEASTEEKPGSFVGVGVTIITGKVTIIAGTDLVFSWKACGTKPGDFDGSFTITVYNGTPPYMVDWEAINLGDTGSGTIMNPQGSYSASGLDWDVYRVTVTDATGATYTANVIINSFKPYPEFKILLRNPTCYGENDGEIIIDTLSAFEPYTIEWSTGHFNVNSIDRLTAGYYSVTITDKYGCSREKLRSIGYDNVEVEATTTSVSCQNESDGFALILASGGEPINTDEYTFTFENGDVITDNVVSRSALEYGWHRVTITDDNGCESVDSFFIDSNKKLVFESLIIDNVQCYGESSGLISIEPGTTGASPAPPYTITADGVNGPFNDTQTGNTTMDFNVPADKYRITLSDAAGCSFDTTLTITQPAPITIDPIVKDVSCKSPDSGYITLHASGGTGRLRYQWSGGTLPPPPADSIWNLTPDTYRVTITDENGCQFQASFQLSSPDLPIITDINTTPISCHGGCDGQLSVQSTPGGNPIREYIWVSGTDTLYGKSIENLCAGNYRVLVVDSAGCYATQIVSLTDPDIIDTSRIQLVNPICAGQAGGSIQLTMTGGTPPYNYNWSVSGAPDSPILSNIGAGTYTVSVTDANGCGPFIESFTLTDPQAILLNITNLQATSCYNTCDGAAIVQASGGITGGPFTYVWEDGTVGSSISNLCSGENYVVVQGQVCSDTFYIDIPSPEPISFNFTDSIPPTCHGDSDGKIAVTGTGGSGSYTYLWGNSSIDSFIANLIVGDYMLTITDANGCTLDTTIHLGEPAILDIRIDSVLNITCAGDNDGFISVESTGGNGGYAYNWSGGVSNSASANNLSNGSYSITVTDMKGCRDTVSTTITAPPLINYTLDTLSDPTCNGEITTVTVLGASGGNGSPFIASLDGQDFSVPGSIDVPAGDYILTIQDQKGCDVDTSFTINEPSPIGIGLPDEIVITLGDSAGINPIISNITGPVISYMWEPPGYVNCDTCKNVRVTLIENATLTFKVTDINGCMGSAIVDIIVDKERNVYIPTAFTPNGDGINELFKIYVNSSVEKINYFRVFNRWGSKVWERKDIPIINNATTVGWNGTFQNSPLKPGVYMFTAEILFKDGVTRNYSGNVTILDTYH